MKPFIDEAIDQTLHFTIGFVITLIVHPASLFQAILLGLALGAIREATEDGNFFSSGSIRDIFFWTLGGLTAGIIWSML